MNRLASGYLIFLSVCLQCCFPREVVTVWKSQQPNPEYYNKLTVAAILTEGNDSLRPVMEEYTAHRLTALGYQTVSTIKAYGPKGLSSLSEEATYRALCDSGIDAILILAMVDKKYTQTTIPGGYFSSTYYYRRIWNYRSLLDQSPDPVTVPDNYYAWESILFDLRLLEVRTVIQVKEADQRPDSQVVKNVTDHIIKEMQRTKVIAKRKSSPGK